MTQANTIEKLRSLLLHLIDEKALSSGLIATAHDYLFRNNGPVPFFVNTELFNTMTYLKDIMTCNGLHDIDDLFDYFERKKRKLASFMGNFRLKAEDQFQQTPDITIHWEKPKEIAKNPGTDSDVLLRYPCCTTRLLSLLPGTFPTSCIVLLPASFRTIEDGQDEVLRQEIRLGTTT